MVIVTEPTLSGFSDLKRVAEMAGKYPAKHYIIINKAYLNLEVSCQIEAWCHEKKILVAGKVTFDEALIKAMVHQKTITEWAPQTETSIKLTQIWDIL